MSHREMEELTAVETPNSLKSKPLMTLSSNKIDPIGDDETGTLTPVLSKAPPLTAPAPSNNPGSKKKKPNKSGCCCCRSQCFSNFGIIFGLDFSHDEGNRNGQSKITVKFIISCFLWLFTWVFFGMVLCKNWSCFNASASFFKPIQCKDNYLWMNNVVDAIFGICCSVSLFLNRKIIGRIFHDAVQSPNENGPDNFQSIQKKSASLGGLMIFFSLILPFVAYLATIGPDAIKLIFMPMKQRIVEGLYIISNMPLASLSTYYCALYALICFMIKGRFQSLIRNGPSLKYPEFNRQHHQCNALVNLTDAAFSQTLPVLYTLRSITVIIWLLFFSWEKCPGYNEFGFKVRCPLLALHFLQIFLLLALPSCLNSVLSMPITAPAERQRSHTFGVYTAEHYATESASNDQIISRPGYVTAGGLRVSVWIVPVVLALGSFIIWSNSNYGWLLDQINKSLQKVIAAIPRQQQQQTSQGWHRRAQT